MPSIHYLSKKKRKGGRIIAALIGLMIGYIIGGQSLEAVKDYAAAERQKHEMAINIIRNDALAKMAMADAAGNMQMVAYYRWVLNHPERVIESMDGPDNVVKKRAYQNRQF